MTLSPSELILNGDGSIYHLNLKPEDLAPIVITVGDPDRVEMVTKHFDSIRLTKQKREFKTQTGNFRGSEISVVSTGIGTDNIDIVLNELDALVNIDFKKREVKTDLTKLKIIRIGTSGAVQEGIPLDSFLVSKMAAGFDNLLHFYESDMIRQAEIEQALKKHFGWTADKNAPYVVGADPELLRNFTSENAIIKGFTATNCGFYGPQGRTLRLKHTDKDFNDKLETFGFDGIKITNLEMETAGIYGLAKLLGHQAVSLNAILANRVLGSFSKNPEKTTENLIQFALEQISHL